MIHYLRHHELDRQQWDLLIEQSPQRQVYAMSWYLDVVTPGWEAVVELDDRGSYKTVMPIPCHSRYGIDYVQQPLYCQQLGMYSQDAVIPGTTYQYMLQAVFKRFRYVVSLQFNTDNRLPPDLDIPKIEAGESMTLYLALSAGYPQIYQGYTRDRKMNLKRAQRAELKIEESEDIEPLIEFFRAETAGRIYGGVNESAYDTLRNLYLALQARGISRLLYTVDTNGCKNAGCLFIIWRGRIVYIFNAAARQGRKLNGRTLILDYIIRQYAGQEFVLDFESPDNAEPDIVHFYRSFGAEPVAFPLVRYNRMPAPVRFLKHMRMHIIRKLRGGPRS